jgi:membrane-bound lytic murein transglycosylase D
MKRSWPVDVLVFLSVLCLPAVAGAQALPFASTGTARASSAAPDEHPSENPSADLSVPLQDLMQKAQKRYLEGSNLIKSGESAKARVEFNKAIDMLLESEWDISSNPSLSRFFLDLVRKIHQDESRYLQSEEPVEEKTEGAVVDELSALELVPIKVDPSLQGMVESDLASTKYDIPIVLNEKVLQSMNFWLNKGKKYFNDGLIRSGRYREMIERTFREESLPMDLLYLAHVESLFKTNAVSRTRNRGIWQFGKGTAVRYGLKVNNYIDERSDPEKSTRAAAKYLTDLYGMFKDWDLVLAAYNWGEGKVQRLIDRSGKNSFWDLMELRRNFPLETKNHVPLIQASVILGHNPEKYGFPKDLDHPIAYDKVVVDRPIDLRSAAKLLGISLEDLKGLNPALRGLSTPAGYPNFELKVPEGIDSDLSQRIAALPAVKFKPPAELPGRYKVQTGDTLTQIAIRFHTTVAAIQTTNGIKSPKSLRVGSWLQVPGSSGTRKVSPGTHIASKRIPSTIKGPAKGRLASTRKITPSHITPKKKTASAKTTPKPKPANQRAAVKGTRSGS